MTVSDQRKPEFLDLRYEQVNNALSAQGLLEAGPLLTEQSYRGIHAEGASSFAEISGLSRRKVSRLEEAFQLTPLVLEAQHPSWDGGARFAWRTHDGHIIESVLIKRHQRYSLCVSSQAGCALACKFCATGLLGLARNLTAGEIVDQVRQVRKMIGQRIGGVVFMGMGEPLQNEDAVLAACSILGHQDSQQISPRKITISTAGLVPAIHRYAESGHRMPLVFSLAAAVPAKRAALMPIQNRYGFEEFLEAMSHYSRSRGGRHITLEYIAIKGLTLGDEDREALREHLVGRFPFILNVIPLNPVEGNGLKAPSRSEVQAWTETLRPLGFPVKIRFSASKDRLGGCGQLGATLTPDPKRARIG